MLFRPCSRCQNPRGAVDLLWRRTRISEAIAGKLSDIDSQRMLRRIEHGKGGKHRYAMLYYYPCVFQTGDGDLPGTLNLKRELQGELDHPRIHGGRKNAAECRAGVLQRRISEIWVVERVEKLGTELQPGLVVDHLHRKLLNQ